MAYFNGKPVKLNAILSGGGGDMTGVIACMNDIKTLLSKVSFYTEDVSELKAQFDAHIAELAGGGGDTYAIVQSLVHVASSNVAVSVAKNGTFSTTLTAEQGYTLDEVSVTMGGTDITSTAYAGGVVNVANVTGNVIITAVAVAPSDITQDGNTLTIRSGVTVEQNTNTLTIS